MFDGNPSLRAAGERYEYTEEMVREYIRCREDILYFAEKYFFIQTIDHGRIKIPLWDFQKRLLKAFIEPPNGKRHVVVLSARQMSKTTVSTIYLLHYALFQKDSNVAILANNEKTARNILASIQMAYMLLPLWLQKGVVNGGWNKGSIQLENGIKMIASSTSSTAIRGTPVSVLMIDECSFIAEHIWEDFYNSVYPTISSGKKSKIIMVSTPKGMNHFFNIYNDAARGKSSFYAVKIPWWERPDRDEKWKEEQLKNMSQIQFRQEFGCQFLGSSNTLVDSDILERMVQETPIEFKYNGALQIFEPPKENEFYVLGVDSGKGSQSDYSVIQVIKVNADKDIEQVAVYRSNTIDVHDYAVVVDDISKYYNNALMMVESNDIGEVVCDVLWNDLECDRLINYDKKGLGIRSTRKTKLAGNLLLKKYIENGWLTIKDSTTIYELSIYEEVSPNVFHAAGQNDHDDCVTSLVWAVFYLTSTFYDPEKNTGDVKKLDGRFKNDIDEIVMFDNDGFFNPNNNQIGDMRFDGDWTDQNNFW